MSDIESTLVNSPPAAAKRPRRARFWLLLAAGVLLGIPLLAYLGIWAYLNLGFLDDSIAQRISKKFGSTARVGSIKSDVLRNLKIRDIAIDPQGPGEPLTIGAAKLDFDPIDLLQNGRMRGITVERPDIDLRYDAKMGWNHTLKVSTEPGPGIQIERFNVNDGTLAVAWPGGGHIKLLNVSASYKSGRGANPFLLRGTLESGEPFGLDGQSGPGTAFDGRLHGSVNLNATVTSVAGFDPGVEGEMRYDFTARRENLAAGETRRAPVSIDGLLKFNHFSWNAPAFQGRPLNLEIDDIAVKAVWNPAVSTAGAGRLEITALNFNNLALNKLPFALGAPDFKITTQILGGVEFENGEPQRAAFSVALRGSNRKSAAAPSLSTMFFSSAPPKAVAADLQLNLVRGTSGAWSVQAFDASDVSIPLASVGKILGLMEKAGVTLGGEMKGVGVRYDPETGVVSGKLRIDGGTLRWVVPQQMKSAAMEAMNSMNMNSEALILKTIGDTGVKDLRAEFDFRVSRDKLWIGGRTAAIPVFVQSMYVDCEECKITAANVILESAELPDGSCTFRAAIKWADGRFTTDAQLLPSGTWTYKGSLSAKGLLDGEALFDGAFDPKNNIAGPFNFSAKGITWTSFSEPVEKSLVAVDEIRGLLVRVEPFSFDPAKPFALAGRFAFDTVKFGTNLISKQDFGIETRAKGVFVRTPREPAGFEIESWSQFNARVDELLKTEELKRSPK